MHQPKWGLFYDFHTMRECPEVGANFDVAGLVAWFESIRVDFTAFPARCNQGFAYYDTAFGIRHPSLTYDLFGELVRQCHAADIAISAYFNLSLSVEEWERHPAWRARRADGGDDFSLCYNTPYADHLAAMVEEVVTRYEVTGLFLDCVFATPCFCPACRADQGDDPAGFALGLRRRLTERLSGLARAIKPDLMIYFNSMPAEEQLESGNYLELECLPNGGWSYEMLPLLGRYLRNFNRPVVGMSARFHHSWGDFGGIRPEASLEYDCIYALANGLALTIGDHFHPRGDFNRPVMELVGGIYGRLQRYGEWLEQAAPRTDIAVLLPEGVWPMCKDEKHNAMAFGVTRMLCELKQQFDIFTYDMEIPDGYPLLILPDEVRLDERRVDAVRRHLARGGAVLATHRGGLRRDVDEFALPEWGLGYLGASPHDPAFIRADGVPGFPAMPVTCYDRGSRVAAAPGTERIAEIVAPFFNRFDEATRPYQYLAPDRATGEPAMTQRDRVVYLTHPLFGAYYNHAQVPMRALIAEALARLLPRPLIRAEGLPPWVKVTVTAQPGRLIVFVISYQPERRGRHYDIVEQPIALAETTFGLRLDGKKAARVYQAPDRRELAARREDDYLYITLPRVDDYAVAVVETEE